MTPEEFLDYLRDFLVTQLAKESPDVLINHDDYSFIYVDVENQGFWKVSVAPVEVK